MGAKVSQRRDWSRYARALDLRLEGKRHYEIAAALGISRERARQMIVAAKRRLAYRVYRGAPRASWKWSQDHNCWKEER
jgi:hypothetical protein